MKSLQKRLLSSPTSPALNIRTMKAMNPKRLSSFLAVLGFIVVFIISLSAVKSTQTFEGYFKKSSSIVGSPPDQGHMDYNETGKVEFNGIKKAEWCIEPQYPPLPFEDCKFKEFLFRYPMNGGLTNALHFALKGAIWAYEENVCYFIDERGPNPAQMAERDPPLENIDPFFERYFEPMSLPRDHEKVKWAMKFHKFVEPDYFQINYHEYGRFNAGLLPIDDPLRHKRRDLQSLFVYDKDNIWVKKYMMRRLFRILPRMRDIACSRLSNYGLDEEYLALSIRRGDKELEVELVSSLQPYIDEAEVAIKTHFGGKVPKIFVASDDCSVMDDIRKVRPGWEFVGECDNATEQNGFILKSARHWTEEQTDKHYEKFVTEMIAMASAKYFVGVSTTNVSFWIYFMRHMDAHDDTWVFVDSDLVPY